MAIESSPKTNLATFMREMREQEAQAKQPGPFLTISRQYGCSGYFLGLLLVHLLSSEARDRPTWKVYHREILQRLAHETHVAAEILDRVRSERPGLLTDFLRNISTQHMPGALEVRNRIDNIIRGLAYDGNAIIIGMGGEGATAEIENGLRIRLAAPLEWRVEKVVESRGVTPAEARAILINHDREWEESRQRMPTRFRRHPAFDLVYNCACFSSGQIAQHIIQAMKMLGMA